MSMQYWPTIGLEGKLISSFELDAVSELAFELIKTYGAIAGREGGKVDEAGRQTFMLQSPVELVIRCFDIAESFYNEAAARNGIRPLNISEKINTIITLRSTVRDFERNSQD